MSVKSISRLCLAVAILIVTSCADDYAETINDDGKKHVGGEVWLAKTSATTFIVIDADGWGLIDGNVQAIRFDDNRENVLLGYKHFDNGSISYSKVHLKTAKVIPINMASKLKDVDKFYSNLE